MSDKNFASQADLRREEGQLRQAVGSRVRVHRRRRPQHRHRRRRRCRDGDRHAGDARDGAGRHPPHSRGDRQADQVRRADALSRCARARRVGVPARAHHRQPRHVRPHRRARRGRHEKRDRALPAAVPRGRVGARPDLADPGVRKAHDAVAGQAPGRDHAARAAATPRATPSCGCRRSASCSPAIWSSTMPRRTPATRTSPTGRRRSTRSRRSTRRSSCPGAARRCRRRSRCKHGLDGTRAFVTQMFDAVQARCRGRARTCSTIYQETYAAAEAEVRPLGDLRPLPAVRRDARLRRGDATTAIRASGPRSATRRCGSAGTLVPLRRHRGLDARAPRAGRPAFRDVPRARALRAARRSTLSRYTNPVYRYVERRNWMGRRRASP